MTNEYPPKLHLLSFDELEVLKRLFQIAMTTGPYGREFLTENEDMKVASLALYNETKRCYRAKLENEDPQNIPLNQLRLVEDVIEHEQDDW